MIQPNNSRKRPFVTMSKQETEPMSDDDDKVEEKKSTKPYVHFLDIFCFSVSSCLAFSFSVCCLSMRSLLNLHVLSVSLSLAIYLCLCLPPTFHLCFPLHLMFPQFSLALFPRVHSISPRYRRPLALKLAAYNPSVVCFLHASQSNAPLSHAGPRKRKIS